jgi:hypothetical protein
MKGFCNAITWNLFETNNDFFYVRVFQSSHAFFWYPKDFSNKKYPFFLEKFDFDSAFTPNIPTQNLLKRQIPSSLSTRVIL